MLQVNAARPDCLVDGEAPGQTPKLAEAGIDLSRPREAAAQIRQLADRDHGPDTGAARQAVVEEEGSAAPRGNNIPNPEAEMRATYAGREHEAIMFETETGLERMTVRQMFDEFAGDAEDFEALKVCVG